MYRAVKLPVFSVLNVLPVWRKLTLSVDCVFREIVGQLKIKVATATHHSEINVNGLDER